MPTSDWRQATDAGSGRVYYWHIKTRQTTWIRPADFDAPPAAQAAPDTAAASGAADVGTQTALAETAETTLAQKPKVLPLHGRVAKAARGASSRLASAVRFGADEMDSAVSPGKSLMKGVYLGSIFVAAAAVL